jgi:endonuclease YncB( thermonuclease family)
MGTCVSTNKHPVEPAKVTLDDKLTENKIENKTKDKTEITDAKLTEKKELKEETLNQILHHMSDDDLETIHENRYNQIPLYVRFTNIYDGDTFDIIFVDPFTKQLTRRTCRAYGYDAPELKPTAKKVPSASQRKKIKKQAIAAREKLIEFIDNCDLIGIVCADKKVKKVKNMEDKKEKFGRTLIEIFKFPKDKFYEGIPEDIEDQCTPKNSLCTYMLENTDSVEYFGGTKD